MDLRNIVKRAPTLLYSAVAVGCFIFSAIMFYMAWYVASSYGNIPVSNDDHAALLNSLMYGSCALLCGLSQTANAIRAWG